MEERIRELIHSRIDALGYETVDVRYFRGRPRATLRVVVDADDGVSVGDCERISRELSMVLDVEDFSRRPYALEVSSPGVDRPLRTERDFRRNLGRSVRVHLKQSAGGRTCVEGELLGCAEGCIEVGTRKGTERIVLRDIHKCKVEPAFK